jgi:predicted lipoprotein with Yx(FWY)xxD motif
VIRTVYGRALADRRGFALYLFTHDRSASVSTCFGACASAWPPYEVATRRLVAGAGLDGAVGALRRPDGRYQVTYAGHPLYHYIGDRRPHEVLCQGVDEFGGTWYVVDVDGAAIH